MRVSSDPCQAGDDGNLEPEKLVLRNVSHQDEGWYTCIAGNTLGFSHSSAYLRVVDGKTPSCLN